MTNKKLIIIGSGGHGRVVADCAEQTGIYQTIMFLDDCFPDRKKNYHWPIIGVADNFQQYISDCDFIVAFGNNRLRYKFLKKLQAVQASIVSIIHPSATVSPHTSIEKGVVIFANAVVNIGSEVSLGSIINTGATVDHDCSIKECVHISPGVNIAGGVNIGKFSWVGIGSTVIEGITLAENTQAGAGAVITESTKDNSLYLGVPAKRIRSLNIN